MVPTQRRAGDHAPRYWGVLYLNDTGIGRTVRLGARLLAVISDDFWFRNTIESRQFFAESVLRAVENRISVARCANMGISGIIDPWGRITHIAPPQTTGVFYAFAPLRTETSPYTRYGDVWAWLCGLAGFGGVVTCGRKNFSRCSKKRCL